MACLLTRTADAARGPRQKAVVGVSQDADIASDDDTNQGSHRTLDTHSAMSTRVLQPSHVSVELCSVSSRLFATLDPLCGPAGLDDTCARLESSTYVRAEEARCIFRIAPNSPADVW